MNIQTLHCFTNEHTTVIAESLKEAKAKWDKWTFFDPIGYDQDEIEDEHDIHQIKDEAILPIFVEDELKHKPEGLLIEGSVWKAPAGAWAACQGKGFLCSEDY
jgi:hypothetical protein